MPQILERIGNTTMIHVRKREEKSTKGLENTEENRIWGYYRFFAVKYGVYYISKENESDKRDIRKTHRSNGRSEYGA
jgi:hypothetical protein